MKKLDVVIRDDEDRNAFIRELLRWTLEKPVRVTSMLYKKNRSAAQNALFAVWCRERGKQSGHGEDYERCYLKLTYGVPIMLCHEYFATAWQPFRQLTYERQLDAMRIIDVTSLMNVEEMTECLNAVENDSYTNGLQLTKPGIYDEAMK